MTSLLDSAAVSGADLFQIICKRQEKLLSIISLYFRITILVAIFRFVFIIRSYKFAALFKTKSLETIISFFMAFFFNLTTSMFIIWAFTFIPFIVFNSFFVSKKFKVSIRGQFIRWAQLFFAVLIPAAIFLVVIWNNGKLVSSHLGTIMTIISWQDTFVQFLASILITIILFSLFSMNLKLPVQLCILNSVIFTIFYLVYGLGFTLFSTSLTIGILFYIVFDTSQIKKTARQMVIYDFDPNIVLELSRITERQQELQILKNKVFLMEQKLITTRNQHKNEIQEIEKKLVEKKDRYLSEIQLMEVELSGRRNEQQIEIQLIETKLSTIKQKLQKLSNILSKSKWYLGINKNEDNLTSANLSYSRNDNKNKVSDDKVSILFFAADPSDTSRLRLGEEFREIYQQIKLSNLRDRFMLELPQLAVRPEEITQALLDMQPQIVHFSGHGTSSGALCFENHEGKTCLVQPAALASLFKQFSNKVNCVLLNACYSEIQARSIAKYIKFVIGMTKTIDDKAAIAFSIGFYQALGAGKTIEDAYELGRVQILLKGIKGDLMPVLIKEVT